MVKVPRRFARVKFTSLILGCLSLGLAIALSIALSIGLPAIAISAVDQVDNTLVANTEATLEQLQNQQKQVEQQRSKLNQEKDKVQKKETTVQQQLSKTKTVIQATATQVAETEQKLKTANATFKTLEAALGRSEKKYEENRQATVARLKFMQRQPQSQGWAVLLQSSSINEFLDRRYRLRRVYERDRHTLQTLKTQSQQIESQRSQVALQRNEIDLLRQQYLNQKAEYQAQAKVQQETITRLRQDKRALESAENKLQKDSESLTGVIQQRIAVQSARLNLGITFTGNGLFAFPTDGPITSVFGYRIHPILGYGRSHDGLDFGVDYGAPIRAVEAGVVLFAGWYGGYGQTIIIGHNGTTTTLYAHNDELYVEEGQMVQRGQVVAAAGSTGFSTGPHLHFEVRVNGEPVDPLPYL
jgi:murein DD-endopeptidase MepM/ murein hydrolase activator NlpD